MWRLFRWLRDAADGARRAHDSTVPATAEFRTTRRGLIALIAAAVAASASEKFVRAVQKLPPLPDLPKRSAFARYMKEEYFPAFDALLHDPFVSKGWCADDSPRTDSFPSGDRMAARRPSARDARSGEAVPKVRRRCRVHRTGVPGELGA